MCAVGTSRNIYYENIWYSNIWLFFFFIHPHSLRFGKNKAYCLIGELNLIQCLTTEMFFQLLCCKIC